MSKVDILTKLFLKNSYQKTIAINVKQKNTMSRKVISIIGFILLFGYLASIFGYFSYTIIDMLIKINQSAVFLGIFLMSIAVFIIFQTIFTSINLMYFSKDIDFVLPFPIKPKELLMAKFNTLLITEYIMEIIFAVVPIFLYGILTSAGIMFYISSILILAIFPILPALLACFIIMIIMSFAKLTKNRDKLQLVTTMLVIIIVIGMQFFFTSNTDLSDEQILNNLLQVNGIVNIIDDYFITLGPSINAMISTDIFTIFISFGKVIGITIIAYLIFILARK